MKIILEGTETELRSVLRSFGIPNETVFDDGTQFLCCDMAGKKPARTFKVIKEQLEDVTKDYLSSKEVPDKPKSLAVDFMPGSDSNEIRALLKEQTNRRRQVYRQLHRS